MRPKLHCLNELKLNIYLTEHGVLAAGVQRRVVSVLHGQTSVDVEARHEVWLTGLRVLQALNDEGGAPFGQQQELFYALEGAKEHTQGDKKTQNIENIFLFASICVPSSLHYY